MIENKITEIIYGYHPFNQGWSELNRTIFPMNLNKFYNLLLDNFGETLWSCINKEGTQILIPLTDSTNGLEVEYLIGRI